MVTEERKQYIKNWKKQNKDRVNESSRLLRKKYRDKITQIKIDSGCIECGIKHPAVLVYHHIKEKEFDISIGLNKGYAMKRILDEMKKCIVLCANCHRILHYDERKKI